MSDEEHRQPQFVARWMSPVATVADVVLPVAVEAIPFDTFVALIALVEIIVELVMTTNDDKSLRRISSGKKTPPATRGPHAAASGSTPPVTEGPSRVSRRPQHERD